MSASLSINITIFNNEMFVGYSCIMILAHNAKSYNEKFEDEVQAISVSSSSVIYGYIIMCFLIILQKKKSTR